MRSGSHEYVDNSRRRVGRRIAVTIALFSCMALTCCGGASVEESPAAIADQDIAAAVRLQIERDHVLDTSRIEVTVDDGIVTVIGTADNMLERERISGIVERVRGVRGLINRIELDVVERGDQEIAEEIRQNLRDDPATGAMDIEVECDGGRVTLTGVVDSWAEKVLAAHVAKTVPGVTGVDDEVHIDFDVDRSDEVIATEIRERLDSDVWVDRQELDVQASDGAVILKGSVGSLYEKSRAAALAHVAGVVDVDDSGVVVKPALLGWMEREKPPAIADDETIRSVLLKALAEDPRISLQGATLEIEVNEGEVELSGVVQDVRSRDAAVETAGNITGVWNVVNSISVIPDEVPSDDTLEKRLRASLAHNSLTSGAEIAVTADDGTVTLYGKVESRAVKDEAFKLAALTKGVAAVKNEIQVKFAWPFMTDDEIRDEIEQEMRWSLFVNADQIDVSVKDGIATLSGRVRTWRERLAAAENAYEGGAHTVINNVEVEQGPGY